jgi:hypothetical protein
MRDRLRRHVTYGESLRSFSSSPRLSALIELPFVSRWALCDHHAEQSLNFCGEPLSFLSKTAKNRVWSGLVWSGERDTRHTEHTEHTDDGPRLRQRMICGEPRKRNAPGTETLGKWNLRRGEQTESSVECRVSNVECRQAFLVTVHRSMNSRLLMT